MGPHGRPEQPKEQLPYKQKPCSSNPQEEYLQQKQQQQSEPQCDGSSKDIQLPDTLQAETLMEGVEAHHEGTDSAGPADPLASISISRSSSSSPSCDACRGLCFHPPKMVAPPARTQEELLQPPAVPELRRDLLQHPQALLSHCTIPSCSSSNSSSNNNSSSSGGRAPWWTAEAQRELFASPFDAAGFPRLPRGAPEKRRLAERGAVSIDLGAFVQKQPRIQQRGQQQQQREKCCKQEEHQSSVGEVMPSGSNSNSKSSSTTASSSSSSSSAVCSRCNGLRLTFGPAGESRSTKGLSPSGAPRRGPLVGVLRRRGHQQHHQQQHAPDDSSASSGSDVPAGELLPDVYLRLAGRRRGRQAIGMEADWLMRLQDPPQGLDALDVFAAAAAAAAAPVALLEPLASSAAAATLSGFAPGSTNSSTTCNLTSSNGSNGSSSSSSNGQRNGDPSPEPLLDAGAPYRPLTYAERLAAFAQARALTSPPLRLSLPQQQQQQHRQQQQPLPLLAALISRGLVRRGAEAAAAAAGGDSAAAAAAAGGPRQRRKGSRPLQGEAHQLDPRLLRKALRCFDRSRGGLSRSSSSSSSSSSRALADFAAVKARLVRLAFGDIPFDPDGLWLRTQQMQQQRQQQLLPDAEQQQQEQQQQQQLQQQQKLDGIASSGTSTLPLMQAAMRRVRLSAKYRHPSVRMSSSSSSSSGGRAQGGGFLQKASVDLGCGVVLATHAASAGSYYFEALVGPVPSQQQQQQLLQQAKHGLPSQQQLQLQHQQVAVSSQCDLRVGWSTRRHPPSAPLGSTRDSVALTLRGTAAWAGIEVPCCYPPLVEGDIVGCCIRLLQPEEAAQQKQQQQRQQEQQPDAAGAAAARFDAGAVAASAGAAPAAASAAAASSATAPAVAGEAYSVSCLMDLDRLAQGFLRSAAGLSDGGGSSPSVSGAPKGSLVQFTVNGRALSPCFFKGDTAGCLLVGEYFPAVSLMGGASCSVNFGPSFCYPPPAAVPPYSPCCLLPLPVAPPLTFDVYRLLLLPQQLVADPDLSVLRPRTFADVLEQRILSPQQQHCPHHRPTKRRALQATTGETPAAAGPDAAVGSTADGGAAEWGHPQHSDVVAEQKQTTDQKRQPGPSREDSVKPCCPQGEQAEASAACFSSSSSCCCCCCNSRTGVGVTGRDCCSRSGQDSAEAEMLRAAQALALPPEMLRQLQTGLRRQQQRQQLLQSIHRCAFESQLKSCNAVLDAAAKVWGVSRAYRLRKKTPWARHRSNLRNSSSGSSTSSTSSSSSSDESINPVATPARSAATDGRVAAGGVAAQWQGAVIPSAASDSDGTNATATIEATATAAAEAPAGSSSSSNNNSSSSSGGDLYVDFMNPCSVLFSFLLPTLRGLYPPAPPPVPTAASNQIIPATTTSGGRTAGESAAATESLAAWKRFARLFWLVVAPLDSQRRPLCPRVFIRNEAIAMQRKAKPSAAARATAMQAAATGAAAAAAAAVSAGGPGSGTGAAASDAVATGRSGRSSGGATRRKGSSNAGPQGAATTGAADAVMYETVQVGQLTLRVPQGALADSGDEEAQPPPEVPPEGMKGKRTAAGGPGVAASATEDDDTNEAMALVEPLPLALVLLRRLGMKPRQLLEGLGCKFRMISRQLAGSHAAIAGIHCIHTAVVRLRHLQAKAQAADEEAAKDMACEFWIEQHASALCGS